MLSWDLLERQNCRCSFDVGDIATKVKSLLMLVTLPPKSSHFWCWWHCHQSHFSTWKAPLLRTGFWHCKMTFRSNLDQHPLNLESMNAQPGEHQHPLNLESRRACSARENIAGTEVSQSQKMYFGTW